MFIKRSKSTSSPANPVRKGFIILFLPFCQRRISSGLKMARLSNGTSSKACFKLFIAGTIPDRLKGLMFRCDLPDDCALLITGCNCVHSMFMLFSIDAIFLNSSLEVIAVKHLKPFRFSMPVKRACSVLEIKYGLSSRFDIRPGDRVVIDEQ